MLHYDLNLAQLGYPSDLILFRIHLQDKTKRLAITCCGLGSNQYHISYLDPELASLMGHSRSGYSLLDLCL
uniref:Uncharacterized protein n=1 Tax=Timema tahoe TaxID=61484 RepID=A0A7R9FKN8_9NEOP|nr:unnamed protein product [Timema tahoe]